jgi:hypothetical protein
LSSTRSCLLSKPPLLRRRTCRTTRQTKKMIAMILSTDVFTDEHGPLKEVERKWW